MLTEPEDIAAITKMHQEQVDLGANTGTMYVYLCYTMKDGSQLERSYEIDPEGNAGQLLKGYYSSVKWIFGTEDVASLLKTATALEVHAYSKELPSVGIYSEIYANRENFDEKWGESGETLTFQETQTLDKNAVALGLMEAVKKDCAEGNMGQAWDYHRTDEVVATIVLERYGSSGFDITVFGNCTHTIAYLKSLSAE